MAVDYRLPLEVRQKRAFMPLLNLKSQFMQTKHRIFLKNQVCETIESYITVISNLIQWESGTKWKGVNELWQSL